MSELRSLVKGLTRTVGSKRAHIANLVGVELLLVRSVITTALSESE